MQPKDKPETKGPFAFGALLLLLVSAAQLSAPVGLDEPRPPARRFYT